MKKSKCHPRSVNGIIVLSLNPTSHSTIVFIQEMTNKQVLTVSDDIDHAEDNVIRSKNELFSDDFSQSIDSSRFSKSTSSTAETDTMTTEDDVEASLYRVSKMSDCDVGCELDYLESKVKDLKIKQDHYGSHAILSTTK